jgi:hypothetical protein
VYGLWLPNEDDICLRARLHPFEYVIFHIV